MMFFTQMEAGLFGRAVRHILFFCSSNLTFRDPSGIILTVSARYLVSWYEVSLVFILGGSIEKYCTTVWALLTELL